MSQQQRTPLYDCHVETGARFTDFAGFEMPVQYSGVIDEHNAVRERVGIFDVSHMGEILVSGEEALSCLQFLTSNNVAKLKPGCAQYSLILNEEGGVVDDIIIYQLSSNQYFICVNASNTEKDFDWLVRHNQTSAKIENVSQDYAQIAIQGPNAMACLAQLLECEEAELSKEHFAAFSFQKHSVCGDSNALVARTGYTGEDGVEIFCTSDVGTQVWRELLRVGDSLGIKPVGLGARDTLRLEACLPLFGHELLEELPALFAGLAWVVKFQKEEFMGREPLFSLKQEGLSRKLVGFEVLDPGIVREGAKLYSEGGEELGWVTSGTKTPWVGKALGLAYLPTETSQIGFECFADVRGRKLRVRQIETPFYKRGEKKQ